MRSWPHEWNFQAWIRRGSGITWPPLVPQRHKVDSPKHTSWFWDIADVGQQTIHWALQRKWSGLCWIFTPQGGKLRHRTTAHDTEGWRFKLLLLTYFSVVVVFSQINAIFPPALNKSSGGFFCYTQSQCLQVGREVLPLTGTHRWCLVFPDYWVRAWASFVL